MLERVFPPNTKKHVGRQCSRRKTSSGAFKLLGFMEMREMQPKARPGSRSALPNALACALAVACASSGSNKAAPASTGAGASGGASGSAGGAGTSAFSPVAPSAYVAKVKNVLVGLPPTDDEVQAVSRDPSQLKALVGSWMQLPEYQQKMLRFFELAFQQTQLSAPDFADQAYPRNITINSALSPELLQNAQESFARTVLELVGAGRPLTEALTTQKFMLTTALKETYAFLDAWEVDDAGKVTDAFKKANPKLGIVAEAAAGPIPFSESLDPNGPNYMHFYDPDVATAGGNVAACMVDPIVYPSSAASLHFLLWGSLDGWTASDGSKCPNSGGSATSAQLASADFSDWTLVQVRPPESGEAVTAFYDLPSLRTAKELVLTIPRVGFFSTPAFFANWQTNTSNQMRVTLNQALIVALGASVDGTDPTRPPSDPPPGLDVMHAGSGECKFCHQTLDPLRSIFSATYSWNYHAQLDATLAAQPGLFVFQGVTQAVASMADFGATLASHPLFASAWVQKLCYYVNSAACSADDPEFQRVVSAFQASNYAFDVLVTELFSSPLVTNASETRTADGAGEVVAVARRDHLCAALDARLGFEDSCNLRTPSKKSAKALVPVIASGLPSDGYGRGSNAPVLPNEPTLFFRAGLENICGSIATQVIDVPSSKQVAGVKQWSSADPNAAIGDFVALVMALPPSDARAAPAAALLQGHYGDALAQGASATNALRSTFVTACLAPSFVSIGL
jgi:hypothetical protein